MARAVRGWCLLGAVDGTVPSVDPTAELVAVLASPDPRLDRAWALLSAHAEPGLDVDATIARIDHLAERCDSPTLTGLCRRLFGPGLFEGNRSDYYDPANSLLPEVLDRRLGIPISLSAVAVEVGRRLGLSLAGIGMPGHFLIADTTEGTFADPFNARFDLRHEDCRALFTSLHGLAVPFDPTFLQPTPTIQILHRMTTNLRVAYQRRADRRNLAWVMGLVAARPGARAEDHRAHAEAAAAVGRFDVAATATSRAAELSGSPRDEARAVALRARLN